MPLLLSEHFSALEQLIGLTMKVLHGEYVWLHNALVSLWSSDCCPIQQPMSCHNDTSSYTENSAPIYKSVQLQAQLAMILISEILSGYTNKRQKTRAHKTMVILLVHHGHPQALHKLWHGEKKHVRSASPLSTAGFISCCSLMLRLLQGPELKLVLRALTR